MYSDPRMYKQHASLQAYMFYNEKEIRSGISGFKSEEI